MSPFALLAASAGVGAVFAALMLRRRGRVITALRTVVAQRGKELAALQASEQGRLEEALRVAEAVVEAMPDPVIVFDGKAQVVRYNASAAQLFGPPLAIGCAADALGDPVVQLAAEEAAVGFPMASSGLPHTALTFKGVKRRFRVRAMPLAGERSGAVLALQDITESDVEANRLRSAADSALFELRPLADALGATLLTTANAGLDEWRALDAVLRDVDGVSADAAVEAVDLAALVEAVLDALSLEAQRRGVRIERRIERPSPSPRTAPVAARRFLLRTLRAALLRLAESGVGQVLTVEVATTPRPAVRITPGASASSPLDGLLLDRAQIVAHLEQHAARETTVLTFAQTG